MDFFVWDCINFYVSYLYKILKHALYDPTFNSQKKKLWWKKNNEEKKRKEYPKQKRDILFSLTNKQFTVWVARRGIPHWNLSKPKRLQNQNGWSFPFRFCRGPYGITFWYFTYLFIYFRPNPILVLELGTSKKD